MFTFDLPGSLVLILLSCLLYLSAGMPGSNLTSTSKRSSAHPAQSAHEADPTPYVSRSSSRVHTPQRFYSGHYRSPATDRSRSRATTASSIHESTISVNEARTQALHTLAICRTVISTLELTRLRKSRIGYSHWIAFWERFYERDLSRALGSRINQSLAKVDSLFRTVAQELHQLTQRTEIAVVQATSDKEILQTLEYMEDQVGIRRRRRRKKARSILERMRADIETIPVKVTDELFDDMKRGVFGLDPYGDYHPGDPEREACEVMSPEQIARWCRMEEAAWPTFYQQWYDDAASAVRNVGMQYLDEYRDGYVSIESMTIADQDEGWRGRENVPFLTQ